MSDRSARAAWRAVALPFLVTRAIALGAGACGAVFIGYTPEPGLPSAWSIDPHPIRNLLARWDTYWYLDIAARGYQWDGNPLAQQNVVFFPLFPLLMRAGGTAIGGHPIVAGLVVSLACFLLALIYFWRWTAARTDPDTATGAVWLLSAFPTALYFSAVYTESLFLLATVAACYYAERGAYGRAAPFGFAAGLTRPNGCLLAVPLAVIAWSGERRAARALAIAAPIAGVVAFSLFLAYRVGSPVAWIVTQAAWSRLSDAARAGADQSVDLTWIPNALALGLVAASLRPVTRTLGAEYGAFLAVNVVPPLLNHGLLSFGRFTSVLFPIFAWLAMRLRGRARRWAIAAFVIGQAVLAALFFSWRAII